MAKIKPATTTAGRISREALASSVGRAASTDRAATTQTLESLRRSVSESSQSTGQGRSKPRQYGGGREAARQREREETVARRRGGSAADDVFREEFARVQEDVEQQIEEREDILGERGGSSDETEVVGDDFDEEIQVIGSIRVYDKIDDSAISDGYIQYLGLHSIGLNRPENANEAQYVQNNETTNGFIAFKTLRVTAGSPPSTTTLKDYYFLTSMPMPFLNYPALRYNYSDKEETFINSKLRTGDRMSLDEMTNLVESFFQIDETARFEGSIVLNKIENKQKIKLTSLPDDTLAEPLQQATEPPATTPAGTPTTSTSPSPTTSPGSSY
jgi:hypothetical protein